MEQNYLNQFEQPSSAFRGAPFWAWNCKLSREQLLRQTEYLKEMGLGGYTIHCRTGLDTPYMGEEFLTLVKEITQKAQKDQMHVYLYDEDRWPSDSVTGEVTRCHEESDTHSARPNIFSVVSPSRYPLRRPVTVRSIPM